MRAGALESLTTANVAETLSYLARRPFDNVYVHWLIATQQIGRTGEVVLSRDDRGALDGVCYLGLQIVPCGSDDAIDAFAARASLARAARMIVGPRPAVERFWSNAAASLPKATATRTRQPVYALERLAPLPRSPERAEAGPARVSADVALARLDELDEIAPNSAEMIAGEVGGDPHRAGAEFRDRTARIIDHGWWWRSRVDGRLAFMCNVGSASPFTAQIQGVWTPPGMRGRGHATEALRAICERLLEEHHSLCLYVNDFNAPAIALYERVGFAPVGEFQTILLP